MLREELKKEIGMSYYDMVDYLLEKYGPAQYDYFCNDTFRSKNKKVSRTKEGLVCHHIDEDKGGNLSGWSAELQPFAWQKKDRLVYCNYLEHLLLHIKIAVLRQKGRLKNNHDVDYFFTTHGINMICEDINGMYLKNGTSLVWKQNCYEIICDNYEDYIGLIKLLFLYIDSQYVGERIEESFLLDPQKSKSLYGQAVEIDYDKLEVKIIGKDEKWYPIYYVKSAMNYAEQVDIIKRELCKPIDGLPIKEFYEDIIDGKPGVFDDSLDELLLDFHGYGHPQYTDAALDTELYPACNVDEYISAAYPSLRTPKIVGKEMPIFWTGQIPRVVKKENYFYIVYAEVEGLRIKDGEEPFAKFKGFPYPEDNRFIETWLSFLDFRDGRTILSSFHSEEEDWLRISLTKDDLPLLKERYDMKSFRILEGCYFLNTFKGGSNKAVPERTRGKKKEEKPKSKGSSNGNRNLAKIGDRVLHKQFGEGVVQAIKTTESDRVLTVKFDEVGVKKLMETLAGLTKTK